MMFKRVLKKNKYCLVVVGEGLLDQDGNYVANSTNAQDAFGHQQLGGIGDFLAGLVEDNLAVKARSSKLVLANVRLLIALLKLITTKLLWLGRLL